MPISTPDLLVRSWVRTLGKNPNACKVPVYLVLFASVVAIPPPIDGWKTGGEFGAQKLRYFVHLLRTRVHGAC